MQFTDWQAASIIVLEDGNVLTKCDQCQQIYAERTPPGTPPCESCRVELREENEDAAAVYMTARRQFITTGQGQIVDISIPAVKMVMDMYGVQDQKSCLVLIMNTFYHFLGKANAS